MNRYDDRARLVFHYAREEGNKLGHAMVGPEHLLLGLMREAGTAAQILGEFGASLEGLRHKVEEIIGRGQGSRLSDAPSITPRARRVMELASAEARALDAPVTKTEHLLLGILREGDGVAYRILQDLTRDVDAIRFRVLANQPSPQDARRAHRQALSAEIEASEQHLERLRQEREKRVRAAEAVETPSSAPRAEGETSANPYAVRARVAFQQAREEAQRLGHAMVGPEHLLIGLMREEGTAAQILQEFGASLEGVRHKVEGVIGRGEGASFTGTPSISPRTRRVLELAAGEARGLGATSVETEHILLGLIREGDGVSFRILQDLQRDVDTIRWRVLANTDPSSRSSRSLDELDGQIAQLETALGHLRAQRDRAEPTPSSAPRSKVTVSSSIRPEPEQPHRLDVLEEQVQRLELELDARSSADARLGRSALERRWQVQAALGVGCVGLGLALALGAGRRSTLGRGALALCAVGAGLWLFGDAMGARSHG